MVQKVKICDTTLRDGQQSLLATRLSLEDILSVAEQMDQIGFYSMEVWGGATFDSCMRFLNEDPWERLRQLRKTIKNTKLQMLLRGQNLLGYRHYADDVVDEFVKRSVANGIDIIRIFDALNDLRNVERSLYATKKEGAHAQVAISYTNSPVHNMNYFVNICKDIKEMGADSICIKDMSGILYPFDAYELVSLIKKATALPVELHCHYTSGMAAMSYLKAVEAGCDILDCAISPMALSASQPADETMIASFAGTKYDTGIDIDALAALAEKFKLIRQEYHKFDLASPQVDPNVLRYQMPGGMISNFISQLREGNALDRLPEVLEEVPRVRADMGYPPLVTPSSQMVGSQALLNVLGGERYKMTTNEIKNYFRGEYGQPPAPVNEQIRKKVIGDEQPITCRPADLLPPQLEAAKNELGVYMETMEDLLSYCLFPQVAKDFLKTRLAGKTNVEFNMVHGAGKPVSYVPI